MFRHARSTHSYYLFFYAHRLMSFVDFSQPQHSDAYAVLGVAVRMRHIGKCFMVLM